MPDLASFQRSFADALMANEPIDNLSWSPRFAVYRNTAARRAVEALRAAFPTVDALLGEDSFTQVALEYRADAPPAGPVLSDYGADFAEFLARQPWSRELPYLADMARLDRLWLDSFLAADADTLPKTLSDQSHIVVHPAARFAWLATPALTIWQAHRDPNGFDELEPEWREEGALFTRPGLSVRVEPISPACLRLLLTCARPARVDECVAAVTNIFPDADVRALLRHCASNGALIIL